MIDIWLKFESPAMFGLLEMIHGSDRNSGAPGIKNLKEGP